MTLKWNFPSSGMLILMMILTFFLLASLSCILLAESRRALKNLEERIKKI